MQEKPDSISKLFARDLNTKFNSIERISLAYGESTATATQTRTGRIPEEN
jgi:hypothetical protein